MFPFTTVKNRLFWSLWIIVAKKPHIVHISNRMIMTLAAVAIFLFPQPNCSPVYARKPRYSSKTLKSMSPEQTGSTASVSPIGTNSKVSLDEVRIRTGIAS